MKIPDFTLFSVEASCSFVIPALVASFPFREASARLRQADIEWKIRYLKNKSVRNFKATRLDWRHASGNLIGYSPHRIRQSFI